MDSPSINLEAELEDIMNTEEEGPPSHTAARPTGPGDVSSSDSEPEAMQEAPQPHGPPAAPAESVRRAKPILPKMQAWMVGAPGEDPVGTVRRLQAGEKKYDSAKSAGITCLQMNGMKICIAVCVA